MISVLVTLRTRILSSFSSESNVWEEQCHLENEFSTPSDLFKTKPYEVRMTSEIDDEYQSFFSFSLVVVIVIRE